MTPPSNVIVEYKIQSGLSIYYMQIKLKPEEVMNGEFLANIDTTHKCSKFYKTANYAVKWVLEHRNAGVTINVETLKFEHY